MGIAYDFKIMLIIENVRIMLVSYGPGEIKPFCLASKILLFSLHSSIF